MKASQTSNITPIKNCIISRNNDAYSHLHERIIQKSLIDNEEKRMRNQNTGEMKERITYFIDVLR